MVKYLFIFLTFFIISSQSHAQDAHVIQLQQFLSGLGYYHGSIDGFDGPKTKAAVAQLQQFLSGSGYYYGAIDGVFNHGTASAWAAYSRDQRPRANVNKYPQQSIGTPRKESSEESLTGRDKDNILIISIAFLICTYFSFQAFKEERTALKLSRVTSLPINTILMICASFNPLLIAISRWASYGMLIFLVFNSSAVMIAGGLLLVRIFFAGIMPINYVAVLNDFHSRATSALGNAAFFAEAKVLRDCIAAVLQRGTL